MPSEIPALYCLGNYSAKIPWGRVGVNCSLLNLQDVYPPFLTYPTRLGKYDAAGYTENLCQDKYKFVKEALSIGNISSFVI